MLQLPVLVFSGLDDLTPLLARRHLVFRREHASALILWVAGHTLMAALLLLESQLSLKMADLTHDLGLFVVVLLSWCVCEEVRGVQLGCHELRRGTCWSHGYLRGEAVRKRSTGLSSHRWGSKSWCLVLGRDVLLLMVLLVHALQLNLDLHLHLLLNVILQLSLDLVLDLLVNLLLQLLLKLVGNFLGIINLLQHL